MAEKLKVIKENGCDVRNKYSGTYTVGCTGL
jgi:hypothetical protein